MVAYKDSYINVFSYWICKKGDFKWYCEASTFNDSPPYTYVFLHVFGLHCVWLSIVPR
jgi:hypothetical protein